MSQTINEKLLNAQLPASVYKLCPNIPAELQQSNFDPIEYVNQQLQNKQFSTDLLNQLIADVDAQVKNIDREIEDIITSQDEVELPELSQTTQLFEDLKKIQNQVEQTQQNSAQFIEKMNRFNNARKQIDYLALNIEFCKQFQDLTAQLPAQLPNDSQQQIDLIQKYATCNCILQYLQSLQDIQQLQQSFKQLNSFTQLVKQIKPQNSHQQDGFNFWTCFSIKYGFLMAANQHQQLVEEIVKQIIQEGFSDLNNDSPLNSQFLNRFRIFYTAHSRYMQDFEKVAIQEVVKGRLIYYDYLNIYGQGDDTQIHQQNKELFLKDSEQINQQFNFYQEFYKLFIKQLKHKIDSYLSKSSTGEVIQTMKLVEGFEQVLIQDDRAGVEPGQVTGIFQQKDEQIVVYILQQLDTYINNTLLPQLTVNIPPNQNSLKTAKQLHGGQLFNDMSQHFMKMLQTMDQIPQRIDLEQAKQVNQKYFDVVTLQILPALEKKLNFTCYVTQAIEKQTKGYKSNQYAQFSEVFKGTVPPLLKLDTFITTGLQLIDYSDTDGQILQCCTDLLKIIKFTKSFFDEVAKKLILRLDTVEKQQEIINIFEFSDQQANYTQLFESGMSSILIGQLVVSSFYSSMNAKEQRQKAQMITAARDVFLNQYHQIIEQLTNFYEDMDLDMFKLIIFNGYVEQIGGFIVGNLLKDQLNSEDYQNIKKSIEIISNEFNQQSEISVNKLKQIINIKSMKADGQEVDRSMFKTMLSQFSECNKWYDEVVVGYVAK